MSNLDELLFKAKKPVPGKQPIAKVIEPIEPAKKNITKFNTFSDLLVSIFEEDLLLKNQGYVMKNGLEVTTSPQVVAIVQSRTTKASFTPSISHIYDNNLYTFLRKKMPDYSLYFNNEVDLLER